MSDSTRYCGACGAKLDMSQMQFCPLCGERVQEDAHASESLNIASVGNAPAGENSPPSPQSAGWNSEHLVGFKPVHARMYSSAGDAGGNLSLVVSGVQFESDNGLARIPFMDIKNVRMTRGMSTFGITLDNGELFEFKVYGGMNYLRTIQNIIANPNVAHQGGIKGTPSQIRAKGVGLIVVGIICLAIVPFMFRVFNPLYIGGFGIVSIITIVNGGKYIAAAKKAEYNK